MLRKVLAVIAVAILTVGSAQAQFKFGARAGVNLTTFTGDVEDAKFKPGFQVGVVGDYSVSEVFAIQPGLVYAQQGCSTEESGAKFTANLNYIQLPVNAQYKLDLGGTKLLLQAGPYLGFGLGGKTKGKEDGVSVSMDIKMGSGDDALLKAFDFGVGVGAGLQFGNIQAALGYNIGLANIAPDVEDSGTTKNSGLALTLTYLFGK
jgi:hypothetical protein